MGTVYVVVLMALGLFFSGLGLWALLPGRRLVLGSGRRAWRKQSDAVRFCLLLGVALLTGGVVEASGQMGLLDEQAVLWFALIPAGLLALALAAFRPRRVA